MIKLCANGEKTLECCQYQFPEDWLYSDQLRGEWSAYEILKCQKNDSIQEQPSKPYHVSFASGLTWFVVGLRLKIVAEGKIVENTDIAMNTINGFEGKLNHVKEEYDLVCRAKEALNLELTCHTRLEPIFEELKNLKAIWTALSGVWGQIGELREMSRATVHPRKLRQ
ncbi:hypothetical protein JVU11DRAFT_10667 [Chiua virens]|nr:hypothetical protein JVU11DRAFT_10667 [Chiua virens]